MGKPSDEKTSGPYGDSDPSAEEQHIAIDPIPNTKEASIQTSNINDLPKFDENQAASNKNEAQTPQVHSIFSQRTKIFLVLITILSTIFSPLSAFIYLPAITPIASSYHRSLADINLTVTVYQIMQALAPLFFGDLSDQIGRRLVYILTFSIYIAANIGLALQKNYAALMVLRALQSTGGSATVAIGNAVMADITTSAERGGYITAVQASVMFAPALAPVLGGLLAEFLGWRAIFWFLVIAAGVFLVVYVPFAPEVSQARGERGVF
jgi:multidrug resistance protein